MLTGFCRDKRIVPFLLLIPLVGILLHYGDLSKPTLCTGDEAITALRSRGLLEHGHMWTPYYDGGVDVHKPPLYYWMVAACYKLLGVGETAIRLPSVISFLALLVLVYLLGRRIYGPWTGWAAAMLVAVHPFALAHARVGVLDTTMVMFFMAAAWFLLRAADDTRCLYAWGLCCGLALLTKGEGATPILPASMLYLLLARRRVFTSSRFYIALLLALALPVAWFGSEYIMYRDAFIKPHYDDFVGYRLKLNIWKSIFVYQKPGRCLWASWGGLAPTLFAAPFVSLFARKNAVRTGERSSILLVLLILVPMIMISMVRQQMYWYCLPMVPPLAILGAHLFVSVVRGRLPWPAVLTIASLLAAGTLLPAAYPHRHGLLWWVRGPALASVLLMAGFGFCQLARRRRALPEADCGWLQHVAHALLAMAALLAITGALLRGDDAVKLHRDRDSGPYRDLAVAVCSLPPNPLPVVVNFRNFPVNSFMFYSHKDTIQLREFSRRAIKPGRTYYGVIWKGAYQGFLDGLQVEKIQTIGEYEILSISNTSPCNIVPAKYTEHR